MHAGLADIEFEGKRMNCVDDRFIRYKSVVINLLMVPASEQLFCRQLLTLGHLGYLKRRLVRIRDSG
jgi:hypothetical protein